MSVVQEWQGYVQSVDEYTFTALLIDVTHGSEPDAVAVFPKSSLTQNDLERLEENVYLRWTLTPDRECPDRMNSRVSLVLDEWTTGEFDASLERAGELASDVLWE